MSPTDRLRINASQVSYEDIDGEVLIINFENGNYYSLRGTAAEIWSLMERGAAVGDIVQAIDRRYQGERRAMGEAISKFIEELRSEALIVHESGDAPQRTSAPRSDSEPGAGQERPAFEIPVMEKHTDVQDLLVLDPIHEVDETGWPTPKASADK